MSCCNWKWAVNFFGSTFFVYVSSSGSDNVVLGWVPFLCGEPRRLVTSAIQGEETWEVVGIYVWLGSMYYQSRGTYPQCYTMLWESTTSLGVHTTIWKYVPPLLDYIPGGYHQYGSAYC